VCHHRLAKIIWRKCWDFVRVRLVLSNYLLLLRLRHVCGGRNSLPKWCVTQIMH
jgi:hypothetical protein